MGAPEVALIFMTYFLFLNLVSINFEEQPELAN